MVREAPCHLENDSTVLGDTDMGVSTNSGPNIDPKQLLFQGHKRNGPLICRNSDAAMSPSTAAQSSDEMSCVAHRKIRAGTVLRPRRFGGIKGCCVLCIGSMARTIVLVYGPCSLDRPETLTDAHMSQLFIGSHRIYTHVRSLLRHNYTLSEQQRETNTTSCA